MKHFRCRELPEVAAVSAVLASAHSEPQEVVKGRDLARRQEEAAGV